MNTFERNRGGEGLEIESSKLSQAIERTKKLTLKMVQVNWWKFSVKFSAMDPDDKVELWQRTLQSECAPQELASDNCLGV